MELDYERELLQKFLVNVTKFYSIFEKCCPIRISLDEVENWIFLKLASRYFLNFDPKFQLYYNDDVRNLLAKYPSFIVLWIKPWKFVRWTVNTHVRRKIIINTDIGEMVLIQN